MSPTPAMDINRGTDTRGDVRARDAATTHGACAVVEWERERFRGTFGFYPVDPGLVIILVNSPRMGKSGWPTGWIFAPILMEASQLDRAPTYTQHNTPSGRDQGSGRVHAVRRPWRTRRTAPRTACPRSRRDTAAEGALRPSSNRRRLIINRPIRSSMPTGRPWTWRAGPRSRRSRRSTSRTCTIRRGSTSRSWPTTSTGRSTVTSGGAVTDTATGKPPPKIQPSPTSSRASRRSPSASPPSASSSPNQPRCRSSSRRPAPCASSSSRRPTADGASTP